MPFTESELHIARGTIAIITLALLGFALIGVDLAQPRDDIGYLSVPLFCSAALIRIRRFFCQLSQHWQEAYEMGVTVGREQEREGRGVRSIR